MPLFFIKKEYYMLYTVNLGYFSINIAYNKYFKNFSTLISNIQEILTLLELKLFLRVKNLC